MVERLERAGLVAKVLPVGTGAWCDVLPAGFDFVAAEAGAPLDAGSRTLHYADAIAGAILEHAARPSGS